MRAMLLDGFRKVWVQGRGAPLLLALISTLAASPSAAQAPRVVATIFPLADIVRRIGGDAVDVITLLPGSASPHTFEPRPAQMRDVSSAVLVVRVGAGLDDWAVKLLAAAATPPQVLAVADHVELLHEDGAEGHAHAGDPHIWLDPILVRDRVAPPILAALQRILPERAAALTQACERLQAELSQLDADIRSALVPLAKRKFIAFHSAWRYFGKRYELEQVAVVEDFPGKEPSARAIAQLIDTARRNGVGAMIVEPQFSPRLAEQIAADFNGRSVTADPMGSSDLADRRNYLDLMRFNAKAFAEALR